MDRSIPTRAASHETPAAGQQVSKDAGNVACPGLARSQTLLAGALAAASLATGVNALVQAAKVLAQLWPR